MKIFNNVYWFANYNTDSPSVRYRSIYPLAYFNNSKGIKTTIVIPGYTLQRITVFLIAYFTVLFSGRKNNLIVIQRVHSVFIYSFLLKILVLLNNKNTIYDIDDADYLENPFSPLYWFAQNCEKVAAGSHAILDHLKKNNPNIAFITSPVIDLSIIKKEKGQIFTIGWIGGFSWGHRESMYLQLFPAVSQLPFACKLILLGVNKAEDRQKICEYFSKDKHVEVVMPENINWKDESVIQQLIVQFDVGIATLLDEPYQLSKSGIKAKQYMNNGIPVLSTDLPENNRFINNDHNGYCCKTSEDFRNSLIRLYRMNHTEYFRMSENARSSVSKFNHERYYMDYLLLYNQENIENNSMVV